MLWFDGKSISISTYISRNFNFIYIYLPCVRSFILFVSIENRRKFIFVSRLSCPISYKEHYSREREREKWAHLKICKKSMRSVLLFPTIDQLVDMELLTLLAEKNATFNRAWKVSPELLFLSLHCKYVLNFN